MREAAGDADLMAARTTDFIHRKHVERGQQQSGEQKGLEW